MKEDLEATLFPLSLNFHRNEASKYIYYIVNTEGRYNINSTIKQTVTT